MKVVAAVVDADSWKANWSENDSEDGGVDNAGYMKSLTTIRSSILDSTGVIDIGRKSDGMHSDFNKDLTFKAKDKDKDQTLKAKDQDKDQTPKDKDKDKDKDQTFKAKDQDKH